MNDRTKIVAGIVVTFFVVGLGIMLLVGLVQGDEVDREENPVRGVAAALPAPGSAS